MKSDYRQFHATITSKPAQNNYEYYEIEYLGELALDSYLSKHQSFDGAFNYIEQIVAEIWSEFID